eukprot:811012-Amphidinium_carterae.1
MVAIALYASTVFLLRTLLQQTSTTMEHLRKVQNYTLPSKVSQAAPMNFEVLDRGGGIPSILGHSIHFGIDHRHASYRQVGAVQVYLLAYQNAIFNTVCNAFLKSYNFETDRAWEKPSAKIQTVSQF